MNDVTSDYKGRGNVAQGAVSASEQSLRNIAAAGIDAYRGMPAGEQVQFLQRASAELEQAHATIQRLQVKAGAYDVLCASIMSRTANYNVTHGEAGFRSLSVQMRDKADEIAKSIQIVREQRQQAAEAEALRRYKEDQERMEAELMANRKKTERAAKRAATIAAKKAVTHGTATPAQVGALVSAGGKTVKRAARSKILPVADTMGG